MQVPGQFVTNRSPCATQVGFCFLRKCAHARLKYTYPPEREIVGLYDGRLMLSWFNVARHREQTKSTPDATRRKK